MQEDKTKANEGWRLRPPRLSPPLVAAIIAANTVAIIVLAAAAGKSPDPATAIPVIAALLAAEAVRAARLALIAAPYSSQPPTRLYPRALLARLLGNTVAALTPSALGGELVRGAIVLGKLNPQALAVGLVDGLYDLYTNTLLAAILAPQAPWPHAAIPLALGLAASTAWLTGFKLASKTRRQQLAQLAQTAARETKRNLHHATILSATAWLIMAAGYAAASHQACQTPPATAAASLLYGYLAGIIPVPGGLGAIDTWLAVTTCPAAAAAMRAATLLQALAALPLLPKTLGKTSREHGYA